MALSVSWKSNNDLWVFAADQLPENDKRNINFSRPNKLGILRELLAETEKCKRKSIEQRWKYTRRSGETVILRDVFDKIVRWIDIFKEVVDIAVQYDPVHAALPWAGVRFVLQIVVNDPNKYATVVEGVDRVAELICRHAVIEDLCLQGTSAATGELERALVKLYAAVLIYLSKTKHYLDQGTVERRLKSAFLAETEFDKYSNYICVAQDDVSRCIALVEREGQIQNHSELKQRLANIDAPLRRMDDNLRDIHDDYQASKRAKILRWLSPEPYLQHHNQVKQGILSGTGQWLLSDPIFKKWKKESASSILWLHGIPGSGKSKLVSIVIEDAITSFEAGNNPHPVFFYCSRNPAEPGRSDPRAILASLARQLSCLKLGNPLLKPTIELYRRKEAEAFASGSLQMDESCTLISQLIEQYPQTTIVIDAMDECDPTKRRDMFLALDRILRDSYGLVKIFVSSRNDQDIVFRLQSYPNLEVESNRNSDDIARFVKDQTERLIEGGGLLRYSTSQSEMKELIVNKVIEGAAGMFRWASMQLQYLCTFNIDADIPKNLGRLPPDLNTLYANIYDVLSTNPGEVQATIFRNTLSWLLCAQKTLRSTEFLAVISLTLQASKNEVAVSKDIVLNICNNFIVFDSQLDTFRFAHLSVREFLELRQEYKRTATNALAAELCLWDLISMKPEPGTKKFLSKLDRSLATGLSRSDGFDEYSVVYWPVHYKLAMGDKCSGTLNKLFTYFISGNGEINAPIIHWNARLSSFLRTDGRLKVAWAWLDRLDDAEAPSHSASAVALFVSCAFDIPEIMEHMTRQQLLQTCFENKKGRTLLHISARHASCESLKYLLKQPGEDIKITEEVVKAAAGNTCSGKEVIALLLEQRGAEVKITEEVVKAAAGNRDSGKEIMALLFETRGAEIKITEEVAKAAARNRRSGKEVMSLLLEQPRGGIILTPGLVEALAGSFNAQSMALLLEQRGAEVRITEEVVKVAAGNRDSGKEIMALLLKQLHSGIVLTPGLVEVLAGSFNAQSMALLLKQRGAEVKITEEVVKGGAGNAGSGKEVMALLLEQRGAEFKITEEVVVAAAGNTSSGKEVMALLLEQRGAEFKITKEVVKAAARNRDSGKEVIALLLEQRGTEVKITEEVVKAAAGNRHSGKEVMALLLEQCGAEVKITEEVVKAAAGNWGSGKEVMELLLEQHSAEVKITEEVVKAAAGNRPSGKEVMALLLEQPRGGIVLTPGLVETLAGSFNAQSMALLLEQRGAEVKIMEEVVKAAASNRYNGEKVSRLQ